MFVVLHVDSHGIFLSNNHTDWQWENEKKKSRGAGCWVAGGEFWTTKNPMERMNDTWMSQELSKWLVNGI